MKMKFLAILVTLMMLISVVPMSSMASQMHKCDFMGPVVSVSDTQHQYTCKGCGKPVGWGVNHFDYNNNKECDACGHKMYPAHKCTFNTLVSISDTQHQFKCSCGKLVGVPAYHMDCNKDGKCDSCGYIKFKPTVKPTAVPTVAPTAVPTVEPTAVPTVEPTIEPTVEPTIEPTVEPTIEPTVEPTIEPTVEPTIEPEVDPTEVPEVKPTEAPEEDDSDAELDNVPKTGSIFVEWLLTLIYG